MRRHVSTLLQRCCLCYFRCLPICWRFDVTPFAYYYCYAAAIAYAILLIARKRMRAIYIYDAAMLMLSY